MATIRQTLLLTLLFSVLTTYGQKRKDIKNIHYTGERNDIKVCFNCDLKEITKQIRFRIKTYDIDTNFIFRLVTNDTLIEVTEFKNIGLADYSFYLNNLLKIRFSELSEDTNDFMLTIMNQSEMEEKQWIVHANEVHTTIYDENSRMEKYFAEIYPDKDTKMEYRKEWNAGKFQSGQLLISKKNKTGTWTLFETKIIGDFDWPESTRVKAKQNSFDGWTDLGKINLAHFIGSFEKNEHLVLNTDTVYSFLPYRLADNLETGTYNIYRDFKRNYSSRLLIDANILNGKLHGVYNEYDISNNKIKIYCVYDNGLLDGRRTIYYYYNDNILNYKITELWKKGQLIERRTH